MYIKELKSTLIQKLLAIYDADEAKNIIEWLLEDRLQLSSIQLKMLSENRVDSAVLQRISQDMQELLNNRPIQQVLGYTYFHGLKIQVNEHVLIPRPETEELVQLIISTLDHSLHYKVLDIGTGTACIPLALKKNLPLLQITAADISTEALVIAQLNASALDIDVNILQMDILSNSIDEAISHFDVIVSNPPYIRLSEKYEMRENVLRYEPHLALFVEDDDALLFYKKIIDFICKHNQKSCYLFLEINELYANEIAILLAQNNFVKISIHQDMQGKERMVSAFYLINE